MKLQTYNLKFPIKMKKSINKIKHQNKIIQKI